MNILILSAGTRNKIVEYFVNTLNGTGKVIVTDMSNLAPAIYGRVFCKYTEWNRKSYCY